MIDWFRNGMEDEWWSTILRRFDVICIKLYQVCNEFDLGNVAKDYRLCDKGEASHVNFMNALK